MLGQSLGESLFGHFQRELARLIVAAQPSTIGSFARRLKHLTRDEGFKLFCGVGNLAYLPRSSE
jgi:hypothetical protein